MFPTLQPQWRNLSHRHEVLLSLPDGWQADWHEQPGQVGGGHHADQVGVTHTGAYTTRFPKP